MGFLNYEPNRRAQGLRAPFRTANEPWQRLADSLGGKFIPGNLRTMTIHKLLVPVGPWTIVVFEGGPGDAGQSQFAAHALYQRRGDFRFRIDVHPTPFKGNFQRFLARPLFKRNLIQIGDPLFDDSSFLQCDDRERARRFFSEQIRTSLLRLAPGRLQIELGKRFKHVADIAYYWFRGGEFVEDLSDVPPAIDLLRLSLYGLVEIGSCDNVTPEFVDWPYLPPQ